ncbi:hypothetical protein LINPERHAP2_LOCUS21900, partial [Linum perenne]
LQHAISVTTSQSPYNTNSFISIPFSSPFSLCKLYPPFQPFSLRIHLLTSAIFSACNSYHDIFISTLITSSTTIFHSITHTAPSLLLRFHHPRRLLLRPILHLPLHSLLLRTPVVFVRSGCVVGCIPIKP